MGNTCTDSSISRNNSLVKLEKIPSLQLLKDNGCQIYKTTYNSGQIIQQLSSIYYWRKSIKQSCNQIFIPQILQYWLEQAPTYCNNQQLDYCVCVLGEKLSNINEMDNINEIDAIDIIVHWIQGIKQLIHIFGGFAITTQILFVDRNKNGKIWINSNIAQNLVEKPIKIINQQQYQRTAMTTIFRIMDKKLKISQDNKRHNFNGSIIYLKKFQQSLQNSNIKKLTISTQRFTQRNKKVNSIKQWKKNRQNKSKNNKKCVQNISKSANNMQIYHTVQKDKQRIQSYTLRPSLKNTKTKKIHDLSFSQDRSKVSLDKKIQDITVDMVDSIFINEIANDVQLDVVVEQSVILQGLD